MNDVDETEFETWFAKYIRDSYAEGDADIAKWMKENDSEVEDIWLAGGKFHLQRAVKDISTKSFRKDVLDLFAALNQYEDWKKVREDKQSLEFNTEEFESVVDEIIGKVVAELKGMID